GPRVSNGVAQSHALTFTWNGSVRSNSCEAAVRLGQQNGSTTGCSACVYPGSPSRTQASDGHFVTVTFTSFCGNGTIDGTGEQCDQGVANGTSSSCCTSNCTFRPSGQVCRPIGGVCDVQETCTGSSGACPADAKLGTATTCRPAAGVCDAAEVCDGVSNACPTDAKFGTATTCRASAGVCDVAEVCDGVSDHCGADLFEPATTVCRGVAGVCDVAEHCTGSSAACPADSVSGAFVVCRPAVGVCDVTENCDGTNVTCPADAKLGTTTTCRAAAGVCDIAEVCSGSSNDCPADAFEPSTTVCRGAAGVCDAVETCTGGDAACPADSKLTSVCRASAGVCDVAESCDGVGDDCPADAVASTAVTCRPSADVCDVAEQCDGVGVACPADAVEPASTVCRPSAGVCDVAENCDGAGVVCPADEFEPNTTVCRPAAGQCDVAESCTGGAAACPADGFEPDGTPCDDGNLCTDPDTCTAGSCTSGTNVNLTCLPCEACDPNTGVCGPGPRSDCIEPSLPGKARVLIKDKSPDKGDLFVWKFVKGEATTVADFGDPTLADGYTLCVFDDGVEVFRASIPAGGTCGTLPCWRTLSTGYKYIDRDRTPDGVLKALLKAGASGRTKVIVKGKGENLPFPASFLPMATPVKVQLQNETPGTCWQTTHLSMGPLVNAVDQYKAAAEGPTP
ncbi:MAG TPA: hypothetical protein VNO26_14345, partial [Candidatus Limnocylindria bacterium]|nr:hypothetical protein [Candidatus Limnocylindria bacterium]